MARGDLASTRPPASSGAQACFECGEEVLAEGPGAEGAVGVEVAVAAGRDEGDLPFAGHSGCSVDCAVGVVLARDQYCGEADRHRVRFDEGCEDVRGEVFGVLVGWGDQEDTPDLRDRVRRTAYWTASGRPRSSRGCG